MKRNATQHTTKQNNEINTHTLTHTRKMMSRKKNAKEFHIRFLANNCRIVSDPIIQNYRNVNNDWAFSVRIKTFKHTHTHATTERVRARPYIICCVRSWCFHFIRYNMHACKHTVYSMNGHQNRHQPICYGFNDTYAQRTRFSTINSLSFRFLMVRENIPCHCSIVCIVIWTTTKMR